MMRQFSARRGEDGFVMVAAIILLMVVASLGAIVMASGNHTAVVTGRGRSWLQSLHVAEAGVQESLVRLQATGASYSGTFTGATDEGTFTTTVTPLGRSRFRVVSKGVVGTGSGLRASRTVRVLLAPPDQFQAALFSYTSIDTKNNDYIVGDVWANQNVVVDANDTVEGNVTAATGYFVMRTWGRVTGNVQSGGYNPADTNAIFVDNNGRIDGYAKASVTAPTDPVTCGGESTNNFTIKLISGSSVGGSTTTWGSKQGSGSVGGSVYNNVCTAAPAAKPIPTFVYNPANYPAATLREYGTPSVPSATAVSDFQTYLSGNAVGLKGTFVIWQSGSLSQANRVDLSGVQISGDLTIITNLPIYSSGITDQAGVTDAVVLLASTYAPPAGTTCDVNNDASDCAVHMKNQFSTSGATACLVYAPNGPVAIKNNAQHFGAVYGSNIQIKNNQTLTYDSRIERVVGFGPVTLEQMDWKELSS